MHWVLTFYFLRFKERAINEKNKGGETDKKLAIFSNYCGDLPFVSKYFLNCVKFTKIIEKNARYCVDFLEDCIEFDSLSFLELLGMDHLDSL